MTQLLKSSIAFMFLFLTYSLTGQSIFSPSVQITKPEVINPTKAIIFDIDNDQLNDILVVGSYPDNIVWFKNLGDYKFSEKNPIYSNENPGAQTGGIVSDDINVDGFLDIVAYEYEYMINPFGGGSYLYRSFYWRENLQGEGFGEMIEINADTNALINGMEWPFYIEDIDGDGHKDLIYGAFPHWTKNLGNGSWGESQSIELSPNNLESYFLGDINSDGLIDIATNNYYSPDSIFVNIDINIGEGQFQFHSKHRFEERVYQVIITDYDSDGISDIIATTYNNVYLIKQIQPNVFELPVLIYSFVSTLPIYPVLVADIDGNGVNDLITQDKVLMNGNNLRAYSKLPIVTTGVLGDSQTNNVDLLQLFSDVLPVVNILEYNGEISSFFYHSVAGTAFTSTETYAKDIDGDGDIDIFNGGCYYECISINPIQYSDCNTLTHKTIRSSGQGTTFIAEFFDIDNDGFSEILLGNRSYLDTVVKFISHNTMDTNVTILSLPPGNQYKVNSALSSDINNDGLEDLILGVELSLGLGIRKALVYLSQPQLGLVFSQELTLPFKPGTFLSKDLDGDGLNEILLYSLTSPLQIYYAEILTSGTLSSFNLLYDFGDDYYNTPANVAFGYINSDNILDFYYADRNGMNGLTMLGQLPKGYFIPGTVLPASYRPHAIADFDSDGLNDLFFSINTEFQISNPFYGSYTNMLRSDIATIQDFLIDSIDYINDYFKFPAGIVITIDLDGDLDLDIIYSDNNRQIRFIENNLSFPTNFKSANTTVENLMAFPNPAKSIAYIKTRDSTPVGTLELLDITGRTIRTFQTNQNAINISFSEFYSGIYFLKATSSNSFLRIVKN